MASSPGIISGSGFRLGFYPEGDSLVLRCGGAAEAALGRCSAGGFSESAGISSLMRRHLAQDAFSASAESVTVIPFGCEYEIRRKCELSRGMALLVCDISALSGGAVASVELEPVFFRGSPSSLEILVYGESALRRFSAPFPENMYAGQEPPLLVRAVYPCGQRIDFMTAGDIWRHRAGLNFGGTGLFRLDCAGGVPVLKRRIFVSDPEIYPAEKRPWRFENALFWSGPEEPAPVSGGYTLDFSSVPVPDSARKPDGSPCLTAAPVRALMRDFIRRRTDVPAAAVNCAPGLCVTGSHTGRAGREIIHGDIGEFAAAYIWGNRQRRRYGGSLTMFFSSGSPFSSGAAAGALSVPPVELTVEEE